MTKLEQLKFLNNYLLDLMPQYKEQSQRFDYEVQEQKSLFRCLINVMPPIKVSKDFIKVQDDFLKDEAKEKGIVSISELKPVKAGSNIYLWRGDITRLKVDAIVNAANSALLGCFIPLHACVDNAIHSSAGVGLRLECSQIMREQGHEEETGGAKISLAYNLPCKHVIHTVGPIIMTKLSEGDKKLLKNCYLSCLKIAEKNKLKSIAFCCISTGEFCFPNDIAAKIAVETVTEYLKDNNSEMSVIFNVFKEYDEKLYKAIF